MSNSPRKFRVRVTDMATGESKANVALPIGLLRMGLRIAARYAPDAVEGLDMDELVAAARSEEAGLLVEVEDEAQGERVQVSIE
jgi:hypothetical protein